MPEMIEVQALVKRFGEFTAVDAIDFAVRGGEMFGFLGPNGAGKSTTIQILATLLRATSGKAMLAGFDVLHQPNQVRQCIGMVFQDPSLDNRLTAEENMRLHAMLYDIPRALFQKRTEQLLAMVGLYDRRKSLVKSLSGGMKRRLEIARGLLHHPKVLFLDEPTLGLDPQTRASIWSHIRQLRDEVGTTVFMTTHYIEEAEVCDRVAIIDKGKIQAIDTPAQLKRGMGGDTIILQGAASLGQRVTDIYDVQVQNIGGDFRFQMPHGAEFVPGMINQLNGLVRSVQVKEPSLEDVFLRFTGRAIRDQDAGRVDAMRRTVGAWRRRRR